MTQRTINFDRTADTRAGARATVGERLGAMQREVLECLRAAGPEGRTDHELAAALQMQPDTARARRCELRDAGEIRDSGSRRPSPSGHLATVWVVADLVPPPAVPVAAAMRAPASPIGDTRRLPPRAIATGVLQIPCRCGSREFVDVQISHGRVRRDCLHCGRFVSFPVWYGGIMPAAFPPSDGLPARRTESTTTCRPTKDPLA